MRPPRSLARAIFCGIFSLPIEILRVGTYVHVQPEPYSYPVHSFPPCFLRRSQKHRCEGRAWLYGRLRLVLA